MNRTAKKIAITALAIAMGALIIFGNVKRSNSTLKDIKATVDCYGEAALVTEKTIVEYINTELPWITNTLIKEIETDEIDNKLKEIPYLYENEVSISMSGSLVIRAKQRNPVVRIINRGTSYYIDSTGIKIPLSEEGHSNVIVANGDIKTTHDLKRITTLATFIFRNETYRTLFDQIYLDTNKDLLLVPKLSNQIILIGDTNDLERKLDNLMTFYKKGMPDAGWESYEKINLKFDNQVICTRNNQ